MKEHVKFAFKVAVALVIISAGVGLLKKFAKIDLGPWLTDPVGTLTGGQ